MTLRLNRVVASGAERVESAFGHKHVKESCFSILNEEKKFCAKELLIRPKHVRSLPVRRQRESFRAIGAIEGRGWAAE